MLGIILAGLLVYSLISFVVILSVCVAAARYNRKQLPSEIGIALRQQDNLVRNDRLASSTTKLIRFVD